MCLIPGVCGALYCPQVHSCFLAVDATSVTLDMLDILLEGAASGSGQAGIGAGFAQGEIGAWYMYAENGG